MSRYTIDDNFYLKYDITKLMVGPLHLAPHDDYLQYMSHANGVKTGVLHSPPPSIALSLVLWKIGQNATLVSPQCSVELKKNGCANRMESSSSHVASSGPYWSHCTFTWPMAQFWSIVTFLSRVRIGSVRNSPSGSTWITSQFITWLGSCTYFLRKETWKTLWALVLAGNASLSGCVWVF